MQEAYETQVLSLGREDPLEKEMATHSSILAWKILWTEEPGRPQFIESQRVEHDWSDLAQGLTKAEGLHPDLCDCWQASGVHWLLARDLSSWPCGPPYRTARDLAPCYHESKWYKKRKSKRVRELPGGKPQSYSLYWKRRPFGSAQCHRSLKPSLGVATRKQASLRPSWKLATNLQHILNTEKMLKKQL